MYMCSAAVDGRCTLWTCKHYSLHKLSTRTYHRCFNKYNSTDKNLTCIIEEKEIRRQCIKVKDITRR